MREIAAKKVRVKPQSAPEKPDDPSYLKGTNIPNRITAPPSNYESVMAVENVEALKKSQGPPSID
jgi:hypothetical protein